MRQFLILASICLSFPGCLHLSRGLEAADPLSRIVAWEDRRSLGNGALMDMTRPDQPTPVRVRALLALGRIQDPVTAPVVAAALGDANLEVRTEAAFAAGLLGLSWDPLPPD